MKDRKVKLNGTVLAGQTLYNLQRTPDVILGDDAGYVRGDILDANAVLTKILELIGGAPEIFDTLKELADAVQSVEEWRNSLKGITTSHINHNGTAREDDTPSFSASATEAALNYVCFSMTNGSATRHCGVDSSYNLKGAKLPVASQTQAGIITAYSWMDILNARNLLDGLNENYDIRHWGDTLNLYVDTSDISQQVECAFSKNSTEGDPDCLVRDPILGYSLVVNGISITYTDADEMNSRSLLFSEEVTFLLTPLNNWTGYYSTPSGVEVRAQFVDHTASGVRGVEDFVTIQVYYDPDLSGIGSLHAEISASGYVTIETVDIRVKTIQQILDEKEDKLKVNTLYGGSHFDINVQFNTYYALDGYVTTGIIVLPNIPDDPVTTTKNIVIFTTIDAHPSSPAITFTNDDGTDIYYADEFSLDAGKTYEIYALYNGVAWIITSIEFNMS